MKTTDYPRKCSITGQGMYCGWCFHDGEIYVKYKSAAIKMAKSLGYKNLNEAYDDEAVYWTQWDENDILD